MLLDFGCFEAHSFPDDQEYAASDSGLVDVSHVAVARTFDAFRGFAVDHHRAGSNDLINFLRRRAILQVAAIEAEFFLHPLHFWVCRLVVPDVQFPSNHVRNQNR